MNHVPLSRRRSGADRPARRADPGSLLHAHPMLPHIRDGRVRGLAVTSAARSKLAPELPTMVESGFDQFVMTSISAIVAPPGTPIDIRRRLNEAVAVRSPPRTSSGHYREWAARRDRHRRRSSRLSWRRNTDAGPASSRPRGFGRLRRRGGAPPARGIRATVLGPMRALTGTPIRAGIMACATRSPRRRGRAASAAR